MKQLTICLSYYENPLMLQHQQRVLEKYPDHIRLGIKLIVADDGSTEKSAHAAALDPYGYRLEVYRIKQHIPWGQKGARNLATWHAPEGWLLATDIDHVLFPDATEKLWQRELDPDCYYIPARRKPDGEPYHAHPNTYLMTRKMFWDDVGGTNEDLDGYYGTDGPFRSRLERIGKRVELHDVPLTVYNLGGEDIGGIPGAACSHHGRKGSEFHTRSHPGLRVMIDRIRHVRPTNSLRREWERMI